MATFVGVNWNLLRIFDGCIVRQMSDMSMATTIRQNVSTEEGFIDISRDLRSRCSNTSHTDNRSFVNVPDPPQPEEFWGHRIPIQF